MLWNRTDNWIPPTSLPARISSKNDEIPLPKNQRKCLQENPASCRASSDSARAKNSAFSAVGQNPRSRPWRFKSPHNMCKFATRSLLPISCRTLTYRYRSAAQDLSSETCFLPKSWRQHTYMPHLTISNRGGGVGRQIPWAHRGCNF